jgi:hypothetical protein
MKTRCFNPNASGYENYGGRGITVCERWRESFENFYSDRGPRPKGYSLDRKDVDGPYDATNTEWATIEQQARNRRNNHRVSYQDELMIMTDFAAVIGLPVSAVHRLLGMGMTTEEVADYARQKAAEPELEPEPSFDSAQAVQNVVI